MKPWLVDMIALTGFGAALAVALAYAKPDAVLGLGVGMVIYGAAAMVR